MSRVDAIHMSTRVALLCPVFISDMFHVDRHDMFHVNFTCAHRKSDTGPHTSVRTSHLSLDALLRRDNGGNARKCGLLRK